MQSKDFQPLRECPFCGGEAETKMYLWGEHAETHAPIWCYYAFCRACDAMTDNVFKTEEEAIAAWNRRSDAVPVVRGEWRQGKEFSSYPRVPFISTAYYCSNCEGEAYWDTDYGQQLFGFCPNCGAKMESEGST